MKITVILCTYNRCQRLAGALESASAMVPVSGDECEIIVVDNNSTDRTREVVEEFMRRFPGRFRYVFEAKQGKSHALNTGILQSQGEILAFTDDDVTVDRYWLRNLTLPLRNGEYAGVGGRILLDPSFVAPAWLGLEEPFSQSGVLAEFDLGENSCELDRAPYGASMAFKKQVFQSYGAFRTDLGPRPGSQIRGEDTEFGRRLLTSGERLLYEPSAIVFHSVPKERVQKGYFLQWHFDNGRAMAREWKHKASVFGIPGCFLTLAKLICIPLLFGSAVWSLTSNRQRRFYRKCWIWATKGQIVEVYVNWKNGNPKEHRAEGICEGERDNNSMHL
jgi:GT2 family glycosyltransferase